MGHGSPGFGSPVLDPLGSGPRVPMADGLPPGTTFVYEVLGRLGPCSGGQSSHGMTVVWDTGHVLPLLICMMGVVVCCSRASCQAAEKRQAAGRGLRGVRTV